MKVFGIIDQDKFDNMNPVNDIIDELSGNSGSFNEQVLKQGHVVFRNYFDNIFTKIFTDFQYDDGDDIIKLISQNFKTPNIIVLFDPQEGSKNEVDINNKGEYIEYRIRDIDLNNYFKDVQFIANQIFDKFKELRKKY